MNLGSRLLGAVGLLALPQVVLGQTVTTAPFGHAPAVDLSLLVLLAAILAAVTIFRLRRISPALKSAAIALCACVMVVAGAHAGDQITVEGAACNTRSTFEFNGNVFTRLKSKCPQPISIVELNLICDGPGDGLVVEEETLQPCTLGLVLQEYDRCRLPGCVM